MSQLSANDRFEILAETFRRHTGEYAPGKDVPSAVCGKQSSFQNWQIWLKDYEPVVMCGILATMQRFEVAEASQP